MLANAIDAVVNGGSAITMGKRPRRKVTRKVSDGFLYARIDAILDHQDHTR